jgi:hypothetical protein
MQLLGRNEKMRKYMAQVFWRVALMLLAIVIAGGCSRANPVTIKEAGPLQLGSEGRCLQGGGIGVGAKVDNPRSLPLTYRWRATGGQVRVASPSVPAGTYECTEVGVQVVTIEVLLEGKVLDQKSFVIEVLAQPTSTPTPTATPASLPPTATATATPTQAEAHTACPPSGRSPIRTASIPGNLSVLWPQDCAVLSGAEHMVVGSLSEEVPEWSRVWVLVYSTVTKSYWPQPAPGYVPGPAAREGDKFTGLALLGGKGEWYEVVVVLATEEASEALADILREWEARGEYPGLPLEGLPPGLEEKSSIRVYRSD